MPFVIPTMTRSTLRWRLSEWLATGCERMTSDRLAAMGRGDKQQLRTLIVAGEKDRCLPSIAEAERLASILPDTQVHIVEGAGHASTCGSRVDLAALFRNRFPELILDEDNDTDAASTPRTHPRTAMKTSASVSTGVLFGMEPRYDNKTIGLSPLEYWDMKYYRQIPSKLN